MIPITFLNDNSRGNLEQIGREAMANCVEDFITFMNDGKDAGKLYNYGLGFDFTSAQDAKDLKGFYRYQISWGGPSNEIRFYFDDTIEFVCLDWFVGVGFDVTGEEWAEWLKETFDADGSIDWDSKDSDEIEFAFPDEDTMQERWIEEVQDRCTFLGFVDWSHKQIRDNDWPKSEFEWIKDYE